MIDLAATIALTLIPVLLMLLFWQHRRKTLVHPHFLLQAEPGATKRAFRIAWPRLHADSLIDAATAFGLACVLVASGFELQVDPKPENLSAQSRIPGFLAGDEAIVLDLSRSMLHGNAGSRPLDLAVASIMEENTDGSRRGTAGKPRIFGLFFDPHVQKTRLVPIESYLHGDQSITSSIRLASTFPFLTPDYRALATLRRQGFSRIRLFTDGGAPFIHGVQIESFRSPPVSLVPDSAADATASRDATTGEPDPSEKPGVSWPARIHYDRSLERYVIHLVESTPVSEPSLYRLVQSPGRQNAPALPNPLASTEWDLEPLPGGAKITLQTPGLYLLRARRAGSELSFPFYLAPARIGFSAEGPLSEAIADCFPSLEPSTNPQILLLDASAPPPSRMRNAQPQAYPILTDTGFSSPVDRQTSAASAFAMRECRAFLDPALTGGSLVAIEFSGRRQRAPQADFVPGPASLASDALILAYDAAIQATRPPAYLQSPPHLGPAGSARTGSATPAPASRSARTGWQEVGEGWVETTPQGSTILLPDSREYFHSMYKQSFGLPGRSPQRLWWAIGFAILAALKIALHRATFKNRPLQNVAPSD